MYQYDTSKVNDIATDIVNVRTPWENHGLYGQGQVVGVADTGLDQGYSSPAYLHDDFEDGIGNSRILQVIDCVTADESGMDAADLNGHGTHVAGSVLGNGFLWGDSVSSYYNSTSQDVDEYMWNHPDFLILFAASNDGIDKDADGIVDLYSLGAPATAKNCIAVGASESYRPIENDLHWSFPAPPIQGDHVSNNEYGLAAFSSRGPTIDGRYKPDLVAPGTNILSTRTGALPPSQQIGWGNYDSDYVWMGGTSMAAPLTAGAAALMREYLVKEEGFNTPSAALIKASLINSAEDMSPGQYGIGATQEIPDAPVPNNVEGWGRLNLGDGVYPTAPHDILFNDETAGLHTGQYKDYKIVTNQKDMYLVFPSTLRDSPRPAIRFTWTPSRFSPITMHPGRVLRSLSMMTMVQQVLPARSYSANPCPS